MAKQENWLCKRPESLGGSACIATHSIAVWGLEHLRQLETTPEDIIALHPELTESGLEAAWRYAETHRDEIELQIEREVSAAKASWPKDAQVYLYTGEERSDDGEPNWLVGIAID
jgi:uncharacterized protein (DUF433 family)